MGVSDSKGPNLCAQAVFRIIQCRIETSKPVQIEAPRSKLQGVSNVDFI
jgi:hypothetical protein